MTCPNDEDLNALLAAAAPAPDHCDSCRARFDALRAQDRDLREAFAPEQREDAAVAARVMTALPRRRRPSAWPLVPLAAAAGFLAAFLLFRRADRPDPRIGQLEAKVRELETRVKPLPAPSRPLAKLDVATGAVEVRRDGGDWAALPTGGAIQPGSWVRTTGKSKCSFVCDDGSEVRVNSDTEVRFVSPRRVELQRGRIYTNVAPAPERFEVRTDQATIEALGTELDITHVVRTGESEEKKESGRRITTLAVLEGSARIGGSTVATGQVCQVVDGRTQAPARAGDLVMMTRWVHELLRLKGRDAAELEKRVNSLLAQIGKTKMEELYDHEIRSLGDHCALPLTRYIQSSESRKSAYQRRRAARILADIASPPSVPDFVSLLDDGDGEVRACAARGLHRLTGETLGYSEDYWRQESGWTNGCGKWSAWLDQHRDTWGSPKD